MMNVIILSRTIYYSEYFGSTNILPNDCTWPFRNFNGYDLIVVCVCVSVMYVESIKTLASAPKVKDLALHWYKS